MVLHFQLYLEAVFNDIDYRSLQEELHWPQLWVLLHPGCLDYLAQLQCLSWTIPDCMAGGCISTPPPDQSVSHWCYLMENPTWHLVFWRCWEWAQHTSNWNPNVWLLTLHLLRACLNFAHFTAVRQPSVFCRDKWESNFLLVMIITSLWMVYGTYFASLDPACLNTVWHDSLMCRSWGDDQPDSDDTGGIQMAM